MAGMYKLISYDGYVFADHGWTIDADVQNGLEGFSQSGAYLQGGTARPRFASITRQSRTWTWNVFFDPGTDIETQFTDLRRALRFDRTTDAERSLIAERHDGTQMSIEARPRSLIRSQSDRDVGLVYDLTFESGATWWQSVTTETALNTGPTVAGGSVSTSVTVGGEVHARPVIRLYPLAEKTAGLGVTTLPVIVTENSGQNLVQVPWTITFDHAAAVTAGKSTSGGTDILVTVDGLAVNRTITGANTSTCRVTFPLTVNASSTVEVDISYAASGQTYGGGGYAQDAVIFTVSEQAGLSLTNYPYRLTFDHAAKVTAGRSKSSGADIRVYVDGIEQDRALSGTNTSTCKVWAKLSLAANGTSVVCITTAASGYDYAGATFTPGNGAVDLSISTNSSIVYTTPVISNNDDTPFALKPILTKIGAVSDPTNYQAANYSATDPGIKASIMDIASPAQNGNYVRFYAGGVGLASISAAYDYQNSTTSTMRSQSYIGQSSDLSTWTSMHLFVAAFGAHNIAYRTDAFTSGTIGGIIGLERTTATQETGTGNANYIQFHGTGSSEVTLALVSADVPTNAALTSPTNSAGTASTPYIFNGVLSDGTRSIAISNAKISQLATLVGGNVTGPGIEIDCENYQALYVDVSGNTTNSLGRQLRKALTITSPDENWLDAEPNATYTVTWTESNMDADGMALRVTVADRWH